MSNTGRGIGGATRSGWEPTAGITSGGVGGAGELPGLQSAEGKVLSERRSGEDRRQQQFDVVERPKHYNVHPSGVEAIELCELLSFNLGNMLKYVWRHNDKSSALEDLKKAAWYARRHYESRIHVPIFSTLQLLDHFTHRAKDVLPHCDHDSLLLVVLQALALGEPKLALERIEHEIEKIGTE